MPPALSVALDMPANLDDLRRASELECDNGCRGLVANLGLGRYEAAFQR